MRAYGAIAAINTCCHCRRDDEGICSCEVSGDDVAVATITGRNRACRSLEEYRRGMSFVLID